MSMHFRIEQLSPAMRAQVEAKLAPKKAGRKDSAQIAQLHETRPPHKFHAVPTQVGDLKFGSRKEAARYLILREMERRGEIQNLLPHGRVELVSNGETICHFEVDFMFERDGKLCAEDTKGRKRGVPWDMYLIKAKLFHAQFGTRVITI